MCIIIDTNRGDLYLADVGENLFVQEWVEKRGRIVVCDDLLDEYGIHGSKMRSHVINQREFGKVRFVTREEMKKGRKILQQTFKSKKVKQLSENDDHILQMAAVSRCKLIFTSDSGLIIDFRKLFDGRNVPVGPKGKKYLAQKSCSE